MKRGLWALAALLALGAAWPSAGVLESVRSLPVQHSGRVKPFDSFCREILWQITGQRQFQRQDPVETVLSILAESDAWQELPLLEVPFIPLREALDMDPKQRRISYSDLLSTRKLMRMLPAIVEKQSRGEKLTMLENETMDLFNRFVVFTDLISHKVNAVPPVSAADREWRPVQQESSWNGMLAGWKEKNAAAFIQSARELRNRLRPAPPRAEAAEWRMDLEVGTNRFQPFRAARWIYLAALILFVVPVGARHQSAWHRLGWIISGVAFFVHAVGIGLRVVLGGRPPVSNFYETMLWIPFVAVGVALLFGRRPQTRHMTVSALILAVVVLLLSEWVPLDSSLTPVVAVLRSNLWLTIHVLTIVASYGALALAAILAHGRAWVFLRGGPRDLAQSLDQSVYRAIQVGVVLLASGIMLGGVWANASWGRYWGWDPKETWALITLLWFLAVLHGRFAGWLKGEGVALATIGGFFLLLMTYYGVSFYLVGLHSYAGGNAKPLPPLLVGYGIGELLFMVWVGTHAWYTGREKTPHV